ncbi:MAG: glycosyltransferase family 2 protein [Ruminococcus sp.]|nr:glycosyltransferase family 2 protein [Ruminococcus sp.]MDD6709383.1 glycosyltransferase family 2 protein [Ruminococcus sp.]
MDKISIVVAVYNAEQTLRKCVDSLLNQTYKNIEIILVNDCSKDNSLDICIEYSKNYDNVKVISNERNFGVSATRNNGIDNSAGEYICFVDSDDYVEPNYLEVLYSNYKKYNTVPICGFVYHDEYNLAKPVTYSWSGNEGLVSLGEAFKLKSELYLTALWNKLFDRRLIVDKNIKFDTDISVGEDLRFSIEYFDKNNISEVYVLKKPLYHYMKLSGNSLMSSFVNDLDREKDSLNLIKKLAVKYNKNADAEYEKALEQVKTSMIYLIMRDKNLSHNNRITKIKKIDSSFNYKKYFFEKVNVYKEKFYSRFKR